jgi:hypothetical protein
MSCMSELLLSPLLLYSQIRWFRGKRKSEHPDYWDPLSSDDRMEDDSASGWTYCSFFLLLLRGTSITSTCHHQAFLSFNWLLVQQAKQATRRHTKDFSAREIKHEIDVRTRETKVGARKRP